jgi:hypothetical protein
MRSERHRDFVLKERNNTNGLSNSILELIGECAPGLILLSQCSDSEVRVGSRSVLKKRPCGGGPAAAAPIIQNEELNVKRGLIKAEETRLFSSRRAWHLRKKSA